jgi:hypothetical protein
MEALGLLFVGTTLLLLVTEAAESFRRLAAATVE